VQQRDHQEGLSQFIWFATPQLGYTRSMAEETGVMTVLKCPACGGRLPLARTPEPSEELRLLCPFCETYVRKPASELIEG
jgi:hypothetical protein